jgi:hypothetical protein
MGFDIRESEVGSGEKLAFDPVGRVVFRWITIAPCESERSRGEEKKGRQSGRAESRSAVSPHGA